MTDEAASARLEFHRSLPGKRMAAGAVIRDGEGRVLIVNATYKDAWELPGGVVEEGESPAAACRREVEEELGLVVPVGDLICVDYNPTTEDYVESLMFLFEIPRLTEQQEESIVVQAEEISEWRYCDLAEARELLGERVGRRLAAVLGKGALRTGLYLESQHDVAHSATAGQRR